MKVCTKCLQPKDVSSFSKSRRSKDGLYSLCKDCKRKSQRASAKIHRPLNKETNHRRTKEWKTRNPEKTAFHTWFGSVRHRAKRQSVQFTIQPDDVTVPDLCPVLGIPLFPGGKNSPNSPSMDQIIPRGGYTPGNLCVMSSRANYLKGNGTLSELVLIGRWASRILRQFPYLRDITIPEHHGPTVSNW